MAVQAQFPSNAGFSPDFRTSSQAANVLDGHLLRSLQRPSVLTGDAMQPPAGFTNANDPSEAPPVFPQQPAPNSSAAQSSNACECAAPSSSGQPAGVSSSDLLVPFQQQNREINALLWIQNERLRLQMMDAHRRCCNAVIAAHGQQLAKRLCEKEAELQYASLVNAELQNKLGQVRAENWLLFKIAKNNEALVASLKKSLEEVNVQNAAAAASAAGMEGYGESEGTSAPAAALRRSIECKLCRDNDACFLVLPCRHLCLCKTCETVICWCPICFEAKKGGVHVLFS